MSKKMLKRSLALGALMAFVITGQAWAATYIEGFGQTKVVADNNVVQSEYQYITNNGERVVGGYNTTPTNMVNSNVTVTGGEFNYIVGGNWNQTVGTESTNIVVDGATVKQVYAGTAFSVSTQSKPTVEAPWVEDQAKNRTTNIAIFSGYFGGKKDNTCDAAEMIVSGGDLLKSWHYASSPTYDRVRSDIESTNIKIVDGVFDAAVVGGSVAIRSTGDKGTGSDIKAVVKNVNIEIVGGEYYDAIVAGGLAWGHQAESVVENAILNISGNGSKKLVFNDNADIYAGGLIDGNGYNERADHIYGENGTENDGSIVKQTSINIDNANVQNIYGTDGYIKPIASNGGYDWTYSQYRGENKGQAVNTILRLTNVTAANVDIPLGSVTLRVEDTADTKGEINIGQTEGMTGLTVTTEGDNKVAVSVEANGEVNDAYAGDYKKMVEERFKVKGYTLLEKDEETGETSLNVDAMTVEEGEVMGAATLNSDGTITVEANEGNAGISDISAVGLMAWRAETNDMNKRLGELRNANGEHGVWVRMVRGESEYNSVKNQYNQYQLGYDEKLSVDKSWTVGMALSYTDAESSFSQGSGENTHKGLAIYGSKLNDDGSFVDLIAKYSRLEHEFDLGTAKGDYDTNGYSVSAEYGRRFQQGNGMWIEPQVELTYGQVDSATYMVGGRTVNQDAMESLVGRVGFSLGKDIKQGNVYARASYLYDFEGETSATYTKGEAKGSFEQDLGGGWWEVGVGANINLSKATYIYADVEKTFGGEVDTNWQWNLGVRYSF